MDLYALSTFPQVFKAELDRHEIAGPLFKNVHSECFLAMINELFVSIYRHPNQTRTDLLYNIHKRLCLTKTHYDAWIECFHNAYSKSQINDINFKKNVIECVHRMQSVMELHEKFKEINDNYTNNISIKEDLANLEALCFRHFT